MSIEATPATSKSLKSVEAPHTNVCKGCGVNFPSRTAVFRHLSATHAACLSEPDRHDYMVHMAKNQKREKVILLYGYWIPPIYEFPFESANATAPDVIRNGEDIAELILQLVENHSTSDDGDDDVAANSSTTAAVTSTASLQNRPNNLSSMKSNRSYGHVRSDVLAQENGTSAVTEVLCAKLLPLVSGSDGKKRAVSDWIASTQQRLSDRLSSLSSRAEIRLFGRQVMPMGKFNAEMDVSHRRVEYLLPAEFVLPKRLLPELPSFTEEARHRLGGKPNVVGEGKCNNDDDDNDDDEAEDNVVVNPAQQASASTSFQRPNDEILNILTRFKRLMKCLTTIVVDLDVADAAAVFEKQFHDQKRKKQLDFRNNKKKHGNKRKDNTDSTIPLAMDAVECFKSDENDDTEEIIEPDGNTNDRGTGKKRERKDKAPPTKMKNDKVLRRKRYHNFTPTVMAHEYLSYRRMDRFYHRATFRLDQSEEEKCRPYFALSMSGDMFLTGQACRIVGLFVAIARGMIDEDFIECVFDEKYPHLVPTPPLPNFASYASDVYYITIEGKVKSILTPRIIDRYENGWNDIATTQSVREWQAKLRYNVANSWAKLGITTDGTLMAEQNWMDSILQPWAVRAQDQLNEYRNWKQQLNLATDTHDSLPSSYPGNISHEATPSAILPLDGVDPTVPPLFEKVLFYLRRANESGLWPSTTPKRQLVMISNVATTSDGEEALVQPASSSLSMAHSKARHNKMSKSSAYVYVEGQGGASGSFSLGAMPGDKCEQPKGNTLFPELMKAAFELEVALCPNRAPSSTIAVNRNAQFRPHTDSGAGAGQSTSLIVGIGTYTGGELMVEGTMMDIRYKPVEFDGWKQRHWTMPFQGERYSLVWFTPKGCEGVDFINN